MRLPFTKAVQNVGGGLIFNGMLKKDRMIMRVPLGFEAPTRLDNSGYCTPLESQGQNPWCAAYSMCQLLQASYWRAYGRPTEFDEKQCYTAAKEFDGVHGEGTTLEAVVTVAQTQSLTMPAKSPDIKEQVLIEADDVIFAVHKYGLVLVGLQITDGWQYPKMNGMIGDGQRKIGGHAVLVSGYDLEAGAIWGPNWWGKKWGNQGFWSMTRDQFNAQFMYGYGCAITWKG